MSRLSSQRLSILLWEVFRNSPPNRTYTFPRIRLSTNIFSLNRTIVYLFMTTFTECEGLSSSGNHKLFPIRFPRKVTKFMHMVHLDGSLFSAQFTFSCFQPVCKTCSAGVNHKVWILVYSPIFHRVLSTIPIMVKCSFFLLSVFEFELDCKQLILLVFP